MGELVDVFAARPDLFNPGGVHRQIAPHQPFDDQAGDVWIANGVRVILLKPSCNRLRIEIVHDIPKAQSLEGHRIRELFHLAMKGLHQ